MITNGCSSHFYYETRDYSKFERLKFNRKVDSKKVNKLKKIVAAGGAEFKNYPILVNKAGQIIDGQHRFAVCEQLGLPIYFIVSDTQVDISRLARNNTVQDKWNAETFLNAYADQRIESYVLCRRFRNTHIIGDKKLSVRIAMELLSTDRESCKQFGEGGFKVTRYEEAEELANMLKDFEKYIDLRAVLSPVMARCMQSLYKHEEYDHKQMVDNMALIGAERFMLMQKVKDQLRNLEDIYNYKKHKNVIRFYGK